MQGQTISVTFREAVLSSLLAHAAIVILILLFPDAFTSSSRNATIARRDPNLPIPLQFMTEPEPDSMAFGDAGRQISSDPRSPDAPPPRNQDPYARGNTPNRFVAPPAPAPPAPTPGMVSAAAPADGAEKEGEQADEPMEGEGPDKERAGTETEVADAGTLSKNAPSGGGTARRGDAQQPQRSLREALDNLSGSGGLSGGAPLRFDNPVGGLTGPSGGLSFDTKGFDWGPYARKIYWIIWSNWTRGWPPAARAGLAGISTVRFRIHRDGTISGIIVLDSSGTEAFDTCATLALEASSPLPPLPPEFEKESEGITARFLYNVSEP